MKVERYYVHEESIEEFADKNDLVMEVHERDRPFSPSMRYYARFKNAETKDERVLTGEHGNGASPADAIAAYAAAISMKLLVIDAYGGDTRREIRVPRLIP